MYYQEIYIFPDPETPRYVLREKTFSSLHLAFIHSEKELSGRPETKSTRFGISFPNYHEALHELDYTIRIFAPDEGDFQQLKLEKKLKVMADYLRIGAIQPVPEKHSYACFKRKQIKSGINRLAKRQVKRGNFPNQGIALSELKGKLTKTSLPYIYVNTSSTGKHRLPLFIEKKMTNTKQAGTFTTYGLSKDGSTVPVF